MTTSATASTAQSEGTTGFDAIVVGAGFAGMYMLYRLRELGMSARVIEAGTDVGGTWYWNRYPGARCDVESLQYQYSFSDELQREWNWTERYATQPEILDYARHVADRFDLRRDIEFETRVTAATFDDDASQWVVETDRGGRYTAPFCIMATGCLSASRVPDIPGLDRFEGNWYHTGRWPHEGVDFSGQRVAVIGTGSSGIQSIPEIARQAEHVTVFQRTPNYSIPAMNYPLTPEMIEKSKDEFQQLRRDQATLGSKTNRAPRLPSALDVEEEERQRTYQEKWDQGGTTFLQSFGDLIVNAEANDTAAEFVRERIRETVRDPDTAEALLPRDYPIGTKRICVDIDYFETYNRDNVELVDIRESPIVEITTRGVRTEDAEYEVDSIVFATGFDAMTGALLAMDIRGSGGVSLRDAWAEGPRTYLGLQVAGFPNLFTITGPGSPSVLANMIMAIEQHVDWISDCLVYLRDHGLGRIEPTVEAQDAWVDHVNFMASRTLHPRTNSWYMGANIPGKPRVFMPWIGRFGRYRETCDEVAANGYEGFTLSAAPVRG